MARQLPLSLPHAPGMDRADFIVGDSNRAAVAVIDGWPAWPDKGVCLVGPLGSGKSHLAAIWQDAGGASRIPAGKLHTGQVQEIAAVEALVVEDLNLGSVDEIGLFHLLNLAQERRIALLMTCDREVDDLGFRLPDLVSRLRAMTRLELSPPDDDLLVRVMAKLFSDRQLQVDPGVLTYLAARMERSLETANNLADRLDQEALAKGRAITKRLAGEVLDGLFPGEE